MVLMPGLVCVESGVEKMIPCQDFPGYCGLATRHHSVSVTYWSVIIVQNVVLPFRALAVWCSNLRLKNFCLRLMGRVLQSVTKLSISNRWYK